jgi:hypothetical protein
MKEEGTKAERLQDKVDEERGDHLNHSRTNILKLRIPIHARVDHSFPVRTTFVQGLLSKIVETVALNYSPSHIFAVGSSPLLMRSIDRDPGFPRFPR